MYKSNLYEHQILFLSVFFIDCYRVSIASNKNIMDTVLSKINYNYSYNGQQPLCRRYLCFYDVVYFS